MTKNRSNFFDITILFVEDHDKFETATFKKLVNDIKMVVKKVYCAYNAKEAINFMKQNHNSIDLIITTVELSDMYCFEMLNLIRENRPDILAIIKTPLAHNKIFENISEIDNYNDYIAEPIDIEKLIPLLRSNLQKLLILNEQQKVEKLLLQYKTALDETAEITITNIEGRIRYASDSFCKISGYKKEEIIGQKYNFLRHEDMHNSLFEDMQETLFSKQVWKGRIKNRKKNGTVFYSETTVIPIIDLDNNIAEFLTVSIDVSEYIKEFINARESEKTKDAFLANISHEIRTPLNGILGYTQLLASANLETKEKDYIDIVHKSANSLFSIVNDILDISKIQSGKMEIEKIAFNPYEEFHSVAKLFHIKADEKQIALAFYIEPKIPKLLIGDPLKIKQILSNLIDNAIKFTLKKGVIFVNIKLKNIDEDSCLLEFSIKDNGIGISKEKQKFIFNPFMQANSSTTREYGGTGLGLTITSNLISLMGSKVKLISKENIGSKFKFILKFSYQEDNAIAMKNTSIREKKFNFASVLVAEDNEINQQLICDILSMKNITVTIANNGKEAYEYIKSEKFDLIFMDINMPIMDGISATENILAYEKKYKLPHTPIIALSANVISGDKERFLQVGMDDFLSKPFELTAFNSILENFLGKVAKDSFDSEVIASSLGISPDNVHIYLEKFFDMVDKELPMMQKDYQNRDFLAIKTTAHKLKGTAGMLKLDNIFKALKEIEKNAKEQKDFAYLEHFQIILDTVEEMRVVEVL